MTRTAAIELTACLSSLEKLIERAHLLNEEYDRRIRSVPIERAAKVESLENAITFGEVRSVDLLCRDALRRWLPDHPELVDQWYVNEERETGSPDEVEYQLRKKRTIMRHAVDLINASVASKERLSERVPEAYSKLRDPVNAFFRDTVRGCDDYDRNVLIMTRFQPGNPTLETIDRVIRQTLAGHGLVGHRADDRCYPADRNLWDNVCTYMLCCKYGIAVLENILVDEFNPNVALEYGFMRALDKPTLLLKELRFTPRADILGTLWEPFDILNIETSVTSAINRWLNDLGENDMAISFAKYGANNEWTDVAPLLRTKIKDGKLRFRVTNEELGGDPARGVEKTLQLTYSYRGRTYTKTILEKDILSLPES